MELLAALEKIITSDFKTAKTEFLRQGIDASIIDSYFKKFKEARDQNKIKSIEEKNIDLWAKMKWVQFKAFVDSLQKTLTKTQQKKQPWKMGAPSGSFKVAENDKWVIYRIETYEAAKKLGTHNWCIVRDEFTWNDYYRGGIESTDGAPSNFYFALSKTKSYDIVKASEPIMYKDDCHKIAIQVYPYRYDFAILYWDASDTNYEKDEFLDLDLDFPQWNYTQPKMCVTCLYRIGSDENYCRCCEDCMTYPCECYEEPGRTTLPDPEDR